MVSERRVRGGLNQADAQCTCGCEYVDGDGCISLDERVSFDMPT